MTILFKLFILVILINFINTYPCQNKIIYNNCVNIALKKTNNLNVYNKNNCHTLKNYNEFILIKNNCINNYHYNAGIYIVIGLILWVFICINL